MILTGKYAQYWPTQDHNILIKLDGNGSISIRDGFMYLALTSTTLKYHPLNNGVVRSATLILQVQLRKLWSMSALSNKHSLDMDNASQRAQIQRNVLVLLRPILIYLGFAKLAEFDAALEEIRNRPLVKFRGELPRRLNLSMQLKPEQLCEVTDGLISYTDEFEGDPPSAASGWACLSDYQTAGLLDSGFYAILGCRTGLADEDIRAVLQGIADVIQSTAMSICQTGLKSAVLEVPFLGEIRFQADTDNIESWDLAYDHKRSTLPLDIVWKLPKTLAQAVVSRTPLPKSMGKEGIKGGKATK